MRIGKTVLSALGLAALTSALPLQFNEQDGWLDLRVVHTNDVHSRYLPVNDFGVSCTEQDMDEGHCYGGSARHKTVIDGLRSASKHSLLLDGGDEVKRDIKQQKNANLTQLMSPFSHLLFSSLTFTIIVSGTSGNRFAWVTETRKGINGPTCGMSEYLFVPLFLFVCMVIPRSHGIIIRPSGYSFLHLLQSKSSHGFCALDVRSHSSHTSCLCSRVFFSGQCHSSGDERAWIRPWNNRKP